MCEFGEPRYSYLPGRPDGVGPGSGYVVCSRRTGGAHIAGLSQESDRRGTQPCRDRNLLWERRLAATGVDRRRSRRDAAPTTKPKTHVRWVCEVEAEIEASLIGRKKRKAAEESPLEADEGLVGSGQWAGCCFSCQLLPYVGSAGPSSPTQLQTVTSILLDSAES